MKARLPLLVFVLGASIFVLGCITPQVLVALVGGSVISRNNVELTAVATLDARTTPNAIDQLWGTAQPTLEATSTPSVENTLRLCQISASLQGIVAACSQVLAFEPTNLNALLNRGIAYAKLDQYAESIADLEIALASLEDAQGFYYRGEAYRELGGYEDALADFTRAFEIDPQFINALLARAHAQRHLGNFEAALADYYQALDLEIDSAQTALAHYGIGHIEMLYRNFDASLPAYDAALSLTPDDISILSNRAAVLVMMGRYAQAIEEIPALIRQDDTYEVFLNRNLMVAYLLGATDRNYEFVLSEAEILLADQISALDFWDMLISSALNDAGQQTLTIESLNMVQIPVELVENTTYRITACALDEGITSDYPSVNPFLILINEDGEIVAYSDDASTLWESVIVYTAESNGDEYTLVIFDENGIEPNGNVEITITEEPR